MTDGIGDFPGLCRKLDYVRDLGVTALWLMPSWVGIPIRAVLILTKGQAGARAWPV